MKTLNDTIKESQIMSELDWFDRNILSHIALYFYEKQVFYRYHLLLEKYGVYDGLHELMAHISKDIRKEIKKQPDGFELRYNKTDFKDIQNVFFENLIIDIDTTSDSGGEYEDAQARLSDDMLIENVYINIYSNDLKYIFSVLYHEITHAYNHWKMMVKSPYGIADLCDQDMYDEIMPSATDSNELEFVKRTLYFTLKPEQNAFIAQLAGDLKNKYGNTKKLKISSPVEALEYIKSTKLYKTYKNLFNCVKLYDEGRIEYETAKAIKDEYNRISKTNYDFDKVFKKLEFLLKRSLKKIEQQIGKLCLDLFENPTSTMPTNTYLK